MATETINPLPERLTLRVSDYQNDDILFDQEQSGLAVVGYNTAGTFAKTRRRAVAQAITHRYNVHPALVAALGGLLSRPSDQPEDAIWVDENHNPAEPVDPPAVRYFLTPANIAEIKARAALRDAEEA